MKFSQWKYAMEVLMTLTFPSVLTELPLGVAAFLPTSWS